VVAASSVLGYTDDAEWIKTLSFAKLRELSVTWLLSDEMAQRYVHANRASLTIAARNLHTWTPFKGLDPENVALFANSAVFGTQFEQNEVPQLAQLIARITVSF
jgi:hypothetical protein